MTVELQSALERELKEASESGDARRIDRAHAAILIALMDCQRKTAERVKQLVIDKDRALQRAKGMALMWRILRYLAAIGGGSLLPFIVKALQHQ